MSKKNLKEYLEATAPKNNKKYEDYLALKEKEQQELQEMADLMEQPEPLRGIRDYDDSWGDDFPETEPDIPLPKIKKAMQEMGATLLESPGDTGGAESPGVDLPGVKTYIGGQPIGEPSYPAKLKNWSPPPGGLDAYASTSERATFQPHRKLKTPQPRRSSAQFMNPSIKVEDEFVGLMNEVNSDNAKLPGDKEMLDKVRDGFKITRTAERTLIYAVVRAKDFTKNVPGQIRCCGGIAFGGYARDQVNDTFLVECVDHIHMGTVPFGLKLSMPNCGSWSVEIPIPEKVLEKTFTPKQRKALATLKEKYSEEEYEVFYLQLLVAN